MGGTYLAVLVLTYSYTSAQLDSGLFERRSSSRSLLLNQCTMTCPPTQLAPLSEHSLGLSFISLDLVLVVDAGKMLAIMSDFRPLYINLNLRIAPKRGRSHAVLICTTRCLLFLSERTS